MVVINKKPEVERMFKLVFQMFVAKLFFAQNASPPHPPQNTIF
jgi:hypothetical protein